MAQFKYTDIHIFDKVGNELPLVFDTNFKVSLPNNYKDTAVFYGILNPDNTVAGFYRHTTGGRYNSDEQVKVQVTCNGNVVTSDATVIKSKSKSFSSYSNNLDEYSVDDIVSLDLNPAAHGLSFPSVTFASGITFNTISTDLVETESLYVLIEEDGVFKKLSESSNDEVANWVKRFKLLFFIDTRKQNDFRFFDATDDEIIWSNKKILDLKNGDYRVDIGFLAKEEGIYEESLIVCLLDTECSEEELPGIIYPLGTIKMNAEAIGEDERYRALFTNFGIPHPEEYMNVFADTDLNEALVDKIAMNKNSKRMFLSYNEIFPYVGTYKALVNAVNVLGYTDVFFKEWYKETGKATNNNVIFDIAYNSSNVVNTINAVSLDERVSLKKLNWLSMVYKINEELLSSGFDQYGFPETIKVHGYNNNEIVVKLIALKDWLEKYIIGLNCRIIDVGGEGVYFERVRLDSYGTYQNIIEWNNEFNIAPYVVETEEANMLIDTSTSIKVNMGFNDSLVTLEDIKGKTIIEYCTGYITPEGKYHEIRPSVKDSDASVFVGGTLDCLESLELVEIKASSSLDTFLFGEGFLYDSSIQTYEEFLDSSIMSSTLRLENNELVFSPIDLYHGKAKQSIFKKCPIILLERANIRRTSAVWSNSILYSISPDLRENTLESFFIKNHRTGEVQSTVDYVTLIPPTIVEDSSVLIKLKPYNSETVLNVNPVITPNPVSDRDGCKEIYSQTSAHYGLKYSADNPLNIPMFSIFGYQVDKIENNINEAEEYYLEILDGKMMFQDDEHNRIIYINFNFDFDTKEQAVDVNMVYNSDDFHITSYYNNPVTDSSLDCSAFNHFMEAGDYTGFMESYSENPEDVIFHEFVHEIEVNNTGEFTIDVIGRDIHNNIFAANCNKKVTVSMPEVGIISYTNEPTSNGFLNLTGVPADTSHLKENFIDFCLYKHNFLIPGISVNKSDSCIFVEYPTYSYGMYSPKKNDQIHFIDITDRFRIDALDSVKTKYKNLEGKSLFETFSLIANPFCHKLFGKYIGPQDKFAISALNNNVFPNADPNNNGIKTVTDYLEEFGTAPVNYSDINLVFFNELGGYPIMQTPAQMACDKAFDLDGDTYKGDYRIVSGDESHKGYVWARIKDTLANVIVSEFTDSIVRLTDNSKVWTLKTYYDSTLPEPEEPSEDSDDVIETPSDEVEDSSVEEREIYSISLGKETEVAKDLANHFINHWIAAGKYEVNSLALGECPDEYESFFVDNDESTTSFVEDLYNCYDSSFMPSDIMDSSCNVFVDESVEHVKTYEVDGKSVTNTLYYPYLLERNYDMSIVYPYLIDGEKQNGNIFYDVLSLYLDHNYADIEDTLLNTSYEFITKTDSHGVSVLNKISSDILDVSIAYDDNDTKKVADVYVKKVLNASSGKLIRMIGKTPLTVTDADNGYGYYAIGYTNEEGLDCVSFRDMMSDYLHVPFDYNKDYIKICIKSVYHVLRNTRSITSNTVNDIISTIYSNLTTYDKAFTVAGIDDIIIKSALLTTKFPEIYYNPETGLNSISYIRKNFALIIASHLAEMSRDNEDDVEIAQNDMNRYMNVMFTIYVYFAITLLLNIKNIVDYIKYTYPSGTYQVYKEGIILYKYLIFTELDLHSKGIVTTQGFAEGLIETVLGQYFLRKDETEIIEDENQGANQNPEAEKEAMVSKIYKYATNELNYPSEIYEEHTIKGYDRIGSYNKVLTNYSIEKYAEIAELNWVTTGEVCPDMIIMQSDIRDYVKNDNPNEAMYAVTVEGEASRDSSADVSNGYLVEIGHAGENPDMDTSTVLEVLDPEAGESPESASELYYVKLPGYAKEGYDKFTSGIPETFTYKIEDLLESKYITTYVKPAWRSEIKIGVIDPTSEMYDKLDPEEQYLYASFINSEFTTSFKVGQIVKIIFESINTKEYIGQSSYEVVGFDILNKGVILRGNINKDYLNIKEEEVWAKLDTIPSGYEIPDGMKDSYLERSKAAISEKLKSNEFAIYQTYIDTDGHLKAKATKIIRENSTYIIITPTLKVPGDKNKDYRTESALIPIKYKYASDASSGNSVGSWYYRVHTIIPNIPGIYAVNIASTISEKVNMYIAYSHIGYVDYKMNVIDSKELPNGTTRVNIESTPMNHRILDFVDDTFSVNVSNFDINDGIASWMNSNRRSTSIYDVTPVITDASVYSYLNIPVELSGESRNIAFEVDFENTGIDKYSSYVKWKVYKTNQIDETHDLLFESYNPILFLDIDKPGIYNVEAIVYDKFGNSTTRLFKGAYKIV